MAGSLLRWLLGLRSGRPRRREAYFMVSGHHSADQTNGWVSAALAIVTELLRWVDVRMRCRGFTLEFRPIDTLVLRAATSQLVRCDGLQYGVWGKYATAANGADYCMISSSALCRVFSSEQKDRIVRLHVLLVRSPSDSSAPAVDTERQGCCVPVRAYIRLHLPTCAWSTDDRAARKTPI